MRVIVTPYIKVQDYKTHNFYADILILTLDIVTNKTTLQVTNLTSNYPWSLAQHSIA